MTEKDILDALAAQEGGGIFLRHLRVGTGFGVDAERTMDGWSIQTNKPWTRTAYEVKLTRSDFARDVAKPLKQRRARLLSNLFYFVTPPDLLRPGDMPLYAGLIEIREGFPDVVVPAPWMETSAPTWRFIAQLARLAMRNGRPAP